MLVLHTNLRADRLTGLSGIGPVGSLVRGNLRFEAFGCRARRLGWADGLGSRIDGEGVRVFSSCRL